MSFVNLRAFVIVFIYARFLELYRIHCLLHNLLIKFTGDKLGLIRPRFHSYRDSVIVILCFN